MFYVNEGHVHGELLVGIVRNLNRLRVLSTKGGDEHMKKPFSLIIIYLDEANIPVSKDMIDAADEVD